MAYSPVVTVQISINTVNLTQQGFGTPIFITAHQVTDERVIEVGSQSELFDLGFATTSPAYLAAGQFFLNSPSVETVKIGRRSGKATANVLGVHATSAESYVLDITYLDGTENGQTYSATVPTTGGETDTATAEAVVAQMAANFPELSNTVTVSSVGSLITVFPVDSDFVAVVSTANSVFQAVDGGSFNTSFAGDETAALTMENILEYDNDFYFVTTEVRPEIEQAFCQGISAKVQTLDKQYFVSSGSDADLKVLGIPENEELYASLFGYLVGEVHANTVAFWHHYGSRVDDQGIDNSAFPECYYVGFNAPYDAGSVTWSNLAVALPPSGQINNNSKPLTTTQITLLGNNYINYVQRDAGVNVIRNGTTCGKEWIDVIRGVHWLTEDMTTSIKELLFNQKGGKVAYTNAGIARVREVLQSSLQRAVNRGFLSSYTLTVPLIRDVSITNFINRLLTNITFTGILSGAIHSVEVSGSVTTPNAL